MSKQLQQIIEKAVSKGFANKNGRMHDYGYVGPLESQWQARYNKETDIFELDHWGTNIVTLEQFSTFPLVAISMDKVSQIVMHLFNYSTIVDEMTSMLATNLLQINLLQKSNL